MKVWMDRRKRLISYILIYALLCGTVGPWAVENSAAAVRHKLYQAANYLPVDQIATQAGIMIDGREVRIETYGSSFYVIDTELASAGGGIITTGSAVIATGAGIVATGTALGLLTGISGDFEISAQGAPALITYQTSRLMGNCQQFRIITQETQGFDVWLLDQSMRPISAVTGLGNTNVWRQALSAYTTYYILVCGRPGASGKFLCSDIMDDYEETFSQAGNLYFNRDYVIETEIAGDVDMLTFYTSSAVSAYHIRMESVVGSGGTYEIYDQSGRKVSQYSGTMDTSSVSFNFSPAIGSRYYFRFTSGQTGRKVLLHIAQTTVQYRITYHLHGGKNAKDNPTSYISTTPKFNLRKPTRSKYLFYGWYTDTTYRTRVYSIEGRYQSNLHLHAKWEKVSPNPAGITSVKSKKAGQAKIKWQKVTGIKGYKLVYGTKRGLHKKTKQKITKKTSLTIRGLKPGKTYYFKICCYSKDSKGKKVYGKYSKIKKVKIRQKKPKKKPKKKKTAVKAGKKTIAKTAKKTTAKTGKKTAAKTAKKTTAKTSKKTAAKTAKKTTAKTGKKTAAKTAKKTTAKTSKKTAAKTTKKTTAKTNKKNTGKAAKKKK